MLAAGAVGLALCLVLVGSRAPLGAIGLTACAFFATGVALSLALASPGFPRVVIGLLPLACALLLPTRFVERLTPAPLHEYLDFIALLSLLAIAGLAAERAWRRCTGYRPVGIELPLAAMCALALANTLASTPALPSFAPVARGYACLFLPPLLLLALAHAGWNRGQVRQAVWLALAAVLGLCLMGLVVAFALWKLLGPAAIQLLPALQEVLARTRAPLGGSGPSGLVLLIAAPLALVQLLHARSRLALAAWTLMLALFALGMLLSVSRTVIAASPLVLGLTAWLCWPSLRRRLRYLGLVAAAALLALAVGVAFYQGSFERLSRLGITESTSDQRRVGSLRVALDVAQLQPVLGAGIGRYYPRRTEEGDLLVLYQPTAYDAHNLYVQAVAEQGVVGTTLYLAVLVVPFWQLLRLRRQARDPWVRDAMGAFAAGVFALLLYSVTSSSVSVMFRLAVCYWSWLGLGFALSRAHEEAS